MTDSDLREFIREQALRHERASQATERWLRIADRRTDEMVKRGDEMIKRSDEVIAELRDLREESRAQRAALFEVLDRIGPGQPPPATA